MCAGTGQNLVWVAKTRAPFGVDKDCRIRVEKSGAFRSADCQKKFVHYIRLQGVVALVQT